MKRAMLLETIGFHRKVVEEPRHIEIQVLGDASGNVVYLWSGSVIAAPPPESRRGGSLAVLDAATRQAMGEQAVKPPVRSATSPQVRSSFVVGKDKSFYFLEMNTRLQVEHPVTEMITGLDLVELMIRVAAGENLPFTQEEVKLNGWAMDARHAEDPFRNFLPSTGRLVRFIPPAEKDSAIRVDTGVYEGGEISCSMTR